MGILHRSAGPPTADPPLGSPRREASSAAVAEPGWGDEAEHAHLKTVTYIADYLGGHQAHDKPRDSVRLKFSDEGVSVHAFKTILEFPWKDVSAISVEGQDEVGSRVTATRFLATGPFALAMKKKTHDRACFITITTTTGEAFFKVGGKESHEMHARLAPFVARTQASAAVSGPTAEAPPSDISAQLAQLATLHQSGALNDAEFQAAKARLL